MNARLELDAAPNLFRYDTKAAAARLEESAWVKSARVRRDFPDGVRIDLVENVPVAIAVIGDLYLVDADGKPFKRATVAEAAAIDLPLITGMTRDELRASPDEAATRLAQAIAAAREWSVPTRPAISEINIDPVRGFTLIPVLGTPAIRIGHGTSDELAVRANLFDRVWASLTPDERTSAKTMHLDNAPTPSRVAIAFASRESPEKEEQHQWAK